MNTQQQQTDQIQHLEDAFDAFSSLSEQLVSSYSHLQNQVHDLTRDLAAARNEKKQLKQVDHVANRLASLLQALPGGVVVLDGQGRVQECNPAAEDLLGTPLKGQQWRSIINRAFAPRLDDGHEVSLKDGRRLSISTSSLQGESGQILLLKDVTETRLLQDTLARYQRLSSMGYMAATLAHQIRTPTASALLYTSQLTKRADDPVRVIYCTDKIRSQLHHIEMMVGDMLSYSKGAVAQDSEQHFSIDALLEKVSAVALAQVEARQGQFDIDLALDGRRCIAGRLDEVVGAVTNIIINAIQACADEPKIHLAISAQQDRVELQINDNGPGIPCDIQANIFDPFVTGRAQGTGLGLAVAKQVVDGLEGQISFETEIGRGTTFKLLLPMLAMSDVSASLASERDNKNEVLL